MALGLDINKPSVKYGAAKDLKFGCPENDDFDVLESVSSNASFGIDMQVKNEVGNTIGVVVGDPKIELTLSGMSAGAPKKLGAITELLVYNAETGSDDAKPAESGENIKFCIKGVKQDNSNEDFMKFEMTAEAYLNVDYDASADLDTGANEFAN